MLWLFLQKLFIFLFYYIGITAFIVYLYANHAIHLFELNVLFNPLSTAPSTSSIKSNYDIIIVGGGTAALTIAAGIESTESVLIIEAGNDFQTPKAPISATIARSIHNIPILTPLLQLQEDFDWQYKTQPQLHACKALVNQISHWPMGKGFGGSQLINNMIYFRGHDNDYRHWFDVPSTKYNFTKDILPYFKEFEQFIELDEPRSTTKLADIFEESESHLLDMVEFSEFCRPKVMQSNGRRWSVADSYHQSEHPNHQIVLNGRVEMVLFDGTHDDKQPAPIKAVGVSYRKNGRLYEVRANRAVILASGTIGTPTILLKSGIGPKHLYENEKNKTKKESTRQPITTSAASTIKTLKTKMRKHLPAVGQFLQDHVTTGLDLITLNQSLGLEPWNLYSFHHISNYYLNGHGPFTMSGCEALGFLRTNDAKDNDQLPDLGFMVIPMGATIDAGVYFRRVLNIDENIWLNYFKPLIATPTISILPIVLHPKSVGHVSVKMTRDDDIETIIQPQYLSHPDDIDVLVTGLKIIVELVNTPAFKALGASINQRPFPGCETETFGSDRYWQCYAQHLTLTAYHPIGTCRMGENITDSVVDPKTFQVHGVEQLYICDASIMPSMPSANPQATVGMLARKFLHSFNENGPTNLVD